MEKMLGLIGFGEAGRTFAAAGGWSGAHVYDRLTDQADTRDAKRADYVAASVAGCESLAQAVRGAEIFISLVTADQALAVARDVAALIAPGTLYCDLNSVEPDTKRGGATLIDAAGGQYVDIAVMAPVDPGRMAVPLLVSGAKADEAKATLAALGFAKIEFVDAKIGRASSIRMIRSVMVKGIEALTAERALAATAAGVSVEVLASLDASDQPKPGGARTDYNLERMMIHGVRRAAEMEEVVKMLDALGTGSVMTRGTVGCQRAIGTLDLKRPAQGLSAKIDQINANKTDSRTSQNRIGVA